MSSSLPSLVARCDHHDIDIKLKYCQEAKLWSLAVFGVAELYARPVYVRGVTVAEVCEATLFTGQATYVPPLPGGAVEADRDVAETANALASRAEPFELYRSGRTVIALRWSVKAPVLDGHPVETFAAETAGQACAMYRAARTRAAVTMRPELRRGESTVGDVMNRRLLRDGTGLQ